MDQQDRIMDGDLQTLGLQSILKMLALSGKTGNYLSLRDQRRFYQFA